MSKSQRSPLLRISRPRFWGYLFGPFLIGIASAPVIDASVRLVLLGLFFTFPANLLVYGFNDIFDYETDKHNEKKKGYEGLLSPKSRKPLLNILAVVGMAGILLVLPSSVSQEVKWAMTGFYFFGLGYSVPPIRAKTKPFFDAYFNVLYIFPAVVSYTFLAGELPLPQLFVAGALWCAAMHAYSAIPDIRADQKAGLKTIATVLGKQKTLLFCAINYIGAALLSASWLGWFSFAALSVYLYILYQSHKTNTRQQLFRYYSYFPIVNMSLGMALFFWIILVVNS